MKETNIGHITIDVCPTCGGVWIERDEIRTLAFYCATGPDALDEKRWHAFTSPHQTFRTARDESPLECPEDRTAMRRYPYIGDSKLLVDRCPLCEGMWFDGWEVLRLFEQFQPNHAQDSLVRGLGQAHREDAQREARQREFLTSLQLALHGGPTGVFLFFLATLIQKVVDQVLNEAAQKESRQRSTRY